MNPLNVWYFSYAYVFRADHLGEDNLSEVSSLEETESPLLVALNYSSSFWVRPCEIPPSHVGMPTYFINVDLV